MKKKDNAESPQALLTTDQLSKVIHMDVGTIRNRLSRGDDMPPSVVIGRRRLFPVSKFNNWINERLEKQEAQYELEHNVGFVEDGFAKYRKGAKGRG